MIVIERPNVRCWVIVVVSSVAIGVAVEAWGARRRVPSSRVLNLCIFGGPRVRDQDNPQRQGTCPRHKTAQPIVVPEGPVVRSGPLAWARFAGRAHLGTRGAAGSWSPVSGEASSSYRRYPSGALFIPSSTSPMFAVDAVLDAAEPRTESPDPGEVGDALARAVDLRPSVLALAKASALASHLAKSPSSLLDHRAGLPSRSATTEVDVRLVHKPPPTRGDAIVPGS